MVQQRLESESLHIMGTDLPAVEVCIDTGKNLPWGSDGSCEIDQSRFSSDGTREDFTFAL